MPGKLLRWLLACLVGLGVHAQCQAGLVEVIAAAERSIGAVGTYSALDNPRFGCRGTGFVVGDGNLLITCAHVLQEPGLGTDKSTLVVQFAGGPGRYDMRPAVVAALDPMHDLVLLRFEGSPLPAMSIAGATSAVEGLSVAFIGFPIGGLLGFAPVTHRGIISSITSLALTSPSSRQLDERAVRRLREGSVEIHQIDGTAYPGNSGGPVFKSETGEVVDVVNMVLAKGTKESALSQPTGISYAIPARFVAELLRQR